jgi:hypothetical protein
MRSKAEGNTMRCIVFELVWAYQRIVTLTSPFISKEGQGYKEGTESVTMLIPIGALFLTCLIYKIYI